MTKLKPNPEINISKVIDDFNESQRQAYQRDESIGSYGRGMPYVIAFHKIVQLFLEDRLFLRDEFTQEMGEELMRILFDLHTQHWK